MNRNKIINDKLNELSKSKFRSSFHLNEKMISYINEKGMDTISNHLIDFINIKLSKYNKDSDGKQTPMKNHPVFIAQHACACCCRSCLEKWHHIPKEKDLTINEKNYIYCLLMRWIEREYNNKYDI